jgi:hypothetical protein
MASPAPRALRAGETYLRTSALRESVPTPTDALSRAVAGYCGPTSLARPQSSMGRLPVALRAFTTRCALLTAPWCVLALLAAPAAARADYFDDAPWKARTERAYAVFGTTYRDTFLVWVTYGAVTTDGTRWSWEKTQDYERIFCGLCTSARIWGAAEEARAWAARTSGASMRNFRPLITHNFLFISVRSMGPMPQAQRPTWRHRAEDLVEVSLRDGRHLTSYGPLKVETRTADLSAPSSEIEEACLQMKGMLEGQTLYTPVELEQLTVASKGSPPKGKDDRLQWEFRRAMYGSGPKEVTFVVPFETNEHTFKARDITGIRLNLMGEWVELRQPEAPGNRTAQP